MLGRAPDGCVNHVHESLYAACGRAVMPGRNRGRGGDPVARRGAWTCRGVAARAFEKLDSRGFPISAFQVARLSRSFPTEPEVEDPH